MRMRNWETSFAIIACEYLIFVLQIYMVYLTLLVAASVVRMRITIPARSLKNTLLARFAVITVCLFADPERKKPYIFLSGDLY